MCSSLRTPPPCQGETEARFPFLIKRTKRLQLQHLSYNKSTADFVYKIMKFVTLSNAVIYNSVT